MSRKWFQHDLNYPVDDLLGVLLCCCLVSTFYAKLYPVMFVLTSAAITFHRRQVLATAWMGWMGVYAAYAIITYARNPSIAEGSTLNIVKLLVNFLFLGQAMLWAYKNRRNSYVIYLDRTLAVILLAMAFQLFIYHSATGFAFLRPAASSAAAGDLYLPNYTVFGPADKNIFGAKLAMFGFLYIIAGWVQFNKLPTGRMLAVVTLAYLTASRTPLVALIAGLIALVFAQQGRRMLKICTIIVTLAGSPFVLVQLLRIDDTKQMNDGFAIRLIYWAAFFQHFDRISIWGNGLVSGKPFLEKYAVYYNGEPQLHNLLLNNYLDFGVVGSIAFLLFFFTYLRQSMRYAPSARYWMVCTVPLLVVMLTLYAGYESEFVTYLFAIFVLSQAVRNNDAFAGKARLPRGSSAVFVGTAQQGARL